MTAIPTNLYACFAARFPAGEATLLETPAGETLSYADLERETGRLANFLTAAGLVRGERVSALVEKSPQALVLYLACLRAGLVFHPLNPAYTTAELDYFLCDAEPAALVADPARADAVFALARAAGTRQCYTLDARGGGSLWQESRGCPTANDVVPVAPAELAVLLYSSGTTGKPKGIGISHGNLSSSTAALAQAWRFTGEDCLLHALPMFHVHGLFMALGCVLWSGSKMLFEPKFEAESTLAAFARASVMMGVPTYYTRLLKHPDLTPAACRNIRLFTCGSAPLLAETFREFEARTGHRLLERYGMTETNVITTNPLTGERKPGSVGRALPDVALRVVDDAGHEVPPGTIGHVEVTGPGVFAGYWRRPEKTREDFTQDGYFKTGDDGMLDDAGYLSLVGRGKDLIITGGLNVYPIEIETVLDGLPSVQESAVIGLPHPDFGEQVVAILILKAGNHFDEAATRANLKQQLAAYKLPKRYHVADELPRNAMGKVQKNLLRERYAGLTG